MGAVEVMSQLMHKGDQIPNNSIIQTDETSTNRSSQAIPIIRSAKYSNVGDSSSESLAQQCVMQINPCGMPHAIGIRIPHNSQGIRSRSGCIIYIIEINDSHMQMSINLHLIDNISSGYKGVDVVESCLHRSSTPGDKCIVNFHVKVDLVVVVG